MPEYKKYTDDELSAIIERAVTDGGRYYSTRLSKERRDAYRYYSGELPAPMHRGNSRYVSMDVYDAVDGMRSQLVEAVSGNSSPAYFSPQQADDVEPARIATEYTNFVVYRQNKGADVIYDVITDGLMCRAGVAKVWWDDRYVSDYKDETFDNLDMGGLGAALVDRPDADVKDLTLAEDTGLLSGTFRTPVSAPQVRIEAVPPEDFGIASGARCIQDAEYVYHRQRLTVSDLLKMGFPRGSVDALNSEGALSQDLEDNARSERLMSGDDDEMQPQNRKVMVYEVYMQLDLEGTGKTSRWQFMYAGKTVFKKQPVDAFPFEEFVPLRIPHAFYGGWYAGHVIPTQNARTALTRAIVDHTVTTTNPRYQVVRGTLTNPKELLENRLGGIVNVSRPDGILPLMQGSLNPFVFQTISLLDDDKEEVTGLSRLSQGLNKDAISSQNSQGMVEQLISVSQVRQKVIARALADFMRRLFLRVYDLVIKNEDRQAIIQVAGNWVEIDPTAWGERKDAEINLALGYGEADREAAKLIQVDQYLSADPRLGPMYQQSNRYNLLIRILEKQGIKDAKAILTDPATIPPPPPDPRAQLEIELMKANIAKIQKDIEIGFAKTQATAQQHASEISLRQAEFEHKMVLDAAELAMAQQTPAPDRRTIVSV
ncbi:portal protein [Nitrospirillum iridis]|uniref:Portal protein n=1 Tax=Nitrospirillum iridis TaxID=765888 RepID=A0A7X0AZQ5_9PROT|nr:hypothetical protein [Nitrospirillum iridis]MBB6253025.1 hypothetical protein [Nitrospirillum iridis]